MKKCIRSAQGGAAHPEHRWDVRTLIICTEIRHMLVQKLLWAFILVMLLIVSCVTMHKDLYDSTPLSPRMLKYSKATRSKYVVVHMDSFWNNEGRDFFNPKPINYRFLLKREEFYSALLYSTRRAVCSIRIGCREGKPRGEICRSEYGDI